MWTPNTFRARLNIKKKNWYIFNFVQYSFQYSARNEPYYAITKQNKLYSVSHMDGINLKGLL